MFCFVMPPRIKGLLLGKSSCYVARTKVSHTPLPSGIHGNGDVHRQNHWLRFLGS